MRLISFVLVDQLILAELNILLLPRLHHEKHSFLLPLGIEAHLLCVSFNVYALTEPFKLSIHVDTGLENPLAPEIVEQTCPLILTTKLKSKVILPVGARMLAVLGHRGGLLERRVSEEGLSCVSHEVCQYLRLEGEHVGGSLAQGHTFLPQSIDGHASVVATHLPPVPLVVVLEPHACHLCVFEGTDLQLMAIVS